MKTIINKHMKFTSISRVMNNYPVAFEDVPKATVMRDDFAGRNEDMSELISNLLRPISTIHRPKQDSQQKLIASTEEYIGMGILIATDLGNMPLLDLLKVYKSRINRSSAYKVFEMAVHVAEELDKVVALATEFGLTPEKLDAFKTQTTEFGETLDSTGVLLTDRRTEWNELARLATTNSKIIRLQIDPFVIFNEKALPEFYRDYMLVRGSRKRKKRTPKTEPGDISGTATDSVTGLPIANATINVLEQEAAYTTDDDGYYLIDELEAGSYTIGCHATGYEVPTRVTSELAAGEALVIDFSMVPVGQQGN